MNNIKWKTRENEVVGEGETYHWQINQQIGPFPYRLTRGAYDFIGNFKTLASAQRVAEWIDRGGHL